MAAWTTAACCGLSSVFAALQSACVFRQLFGIGAGEHHPCTPGFVKVLVKAKDLKEISVLFTGKVEGISLSLGVKGATLLLEGLFTNGAHR